MPTTYGKDSCRDIRSRRYRDRNVLCFMASISKCSELEMRAALLAQKAFQRMHAWVQSQQGCIEDAPLVQKEQTSLSISGRGLNRASAGTSQMLMPSLIPLRRLRGLMALAHGLYNMR